MKINGWKTAFSLFLAISMMFACNKDEPGPNPQGDPNPIRFNAMEVGQKNRYLLLLGEQYSSNEDISKYTDDTLEIEIIGKDANGFLVKEKLIYSDDLSEWMDYLKDEDIQYYLNVTNDTLRISKHSGATLYSRIWGYQIIRVGLPLAQFNNQALHFTGWKPNLDYCECRRSGYTENYELFGQTYDRLNILVDNTPMALDGSGETYTYSASDGLVRFSTYSWWTSDGYGWDLLP